MIVSGEQYCEMNNVSLIFDKTLKKLSLSFSKKYIRIAYITKASSKTYSFPLTDITSFNRLSIQITHSLTKSISGIS